MASPGFEHCLDDDSNHTADLNNEEEDQDDVQILNVGPSPNGRFGRNSVTLDDAGDIDIYHPNEVPHLEWPSSVNEPCPDQDTDTNPTNDEAPMVLWEREEAGRSPPMESWHSPPSSVSLSPSPPSPTSPMPVYPLALSPPEIVNYSPTPPTSISISPSPPPQIGLSHRSPSWSPQRERRSPSPPPQRGHRSPSWSPQRERRSPSSPPCPTSQRGHRSPSWSPQRERRNPSPPLGSPSSVPGPSNCRPIAFKDVSSKTGPSRDRSPEEIHSDASSVQSSTVGSQNARIKKNKNSSTRPSTLVADDSDNSSDTRPVPKMKSRYRMLPRNIMTPTPSPPPSRNPFSIPSSPTQGLNMPQDLLEVDDENQGQSNSHYQRATQQTRGSWYGDNGNFRSRPKFKNRYRPLCRTDSRQPVIKLEQVEASSPSEAVDKVEPLLRSNSEILHGSFPPISRWDRFLAPTDNSNVPADPIEGGESFSAPGTSASDPSSSSPMPRRARGAVPNLPQRWITSRAGNKLPSSVHERGAVPSSQSAQNEDVGGFHDRKFAELRRLRELHPNNHQRGQIVDLEESEPEDSNEIHVNDDNLDRNGRPVRSPSPQIINRKRRLGRSALDAVDSMMEVRRRARGSDNDNLERMASRRRKFGLPARSNTDGARPVPCSSTQSSNNQEIDLVPSRVRSIAPSPRPSNGRLSGPRRFLNGLPENPDQNDRSEVLANAAAIMKKYMIPQVDAGGSTIQENSLPRVRSVDEINQQMNPLPSPALPRRFRKIVVAQRRITESSSDDNQEVIPSMYSPVQLEQGPTQPRLQYRPRVSQNIGRTQFHNQEGASEENARNATATSTETSQSNAGRARNIPVVRTETSTRNISEIISHTRRVLNIPVSSTETSARSGQSSKTSAGDTKKKRLKTSTNANAMQMLAQSSSDRGALGSSWLRSWSRMRSEPSSQGSLEELRPPSSQNSLENQASQSAKRRRIVGSLSQVAKRRRIVSPLSPVSEEEELMSASAIEDEDSSVNNEEGVIPQSGSENQNNSGIRLVSSLSNNVVNLRRAAGTSYSNWSSLVSPRTSRSPSPVEVQRPSSPVEVQRPSSPDEVQRLGPPVLTASSSRSSAVAEGSNVTVSYRNGREQGVVLPCPGTSRTRRDSPVIVENLGTPRESSPVNRYPDPEQSGGSSRDRFDGWVNFTEQLEAERRTMYSRDPRVLRGMARELTSSIYSLHQANRDAQAAVRYTINEVIEERLSPNIETDRAPTEEIRRDFSPSREGIELVPPSLIPMDEEEFADTSPVQDMGIRIREASQLLENVTRNDTVDNVTVWRSREVAQGVSVNGSYEADLAEAIKRSLEDPKPRVHVQEEEIEQSGSNNEAALEEAREASPDGSMEQSRESLPGCSHWNGAASNLHDVVSSTSKPPGPDWQMKYNELLTKHLKLIADLQSSVECPVCMEVPRSAPIPCCNMGHVMCATCWSRSHQCPTCRRDLPGKSATSERCVSHVANRVVDLVPHPCTNRDLGCPFESPATELAAHEEECEYRLIKCPSYRCKKQVSLKKLGEHISSARVPLHNNWSRIEAYPLKTTRCYYGISFDPVRFNFDPVRFTFEGRPCFLQTMANDNRKFTSHFVQMSGTRQECEGYTVRIEVIGKGGFSASQSCQVIPLDLHCLDDEDMIGSRLVMQHQACVDSLIWDKHHEGGYFIVNVNIFKT